MSIFEDEKHLCFWCGSAPTNHESSGKKKSVRISKVADYFKPMMIQCALATIKGKKNPFNPTDYTETVDPYFN